MYGCVLSNVTLNTFLILKFCFKLPRNGAVVQILVWNAEFSNPDWSKNCEHAFSTEQNPEENTFFRALEKVQGKAFSNVSSRMFLCRKVPHVKVCLLGLLP